MTIVDRRRARALARLVAYNQFPVVEWMVLTVWWLVIYFLERPMSFSAWESLGGLGGRIFFAFPIGRALIRRYLPLYVSRGQTRRQFTGSAALVVLSYAGAGALVMAGGLLAESALYQAFGWTHLPFFSHLFDAPHQVWFVVLEYWLLFTVWATAGALITACAHGRRGRRGTLRAATGILQAALLVVVAEGAVGAPLYYPGVVTVSAALPVAATVAICVGVAVLGFWLTRAVAQDVPLTSGGST